MSKELSRSAKYNKSKVNKEEKQATEIEEKPKKSFLKKFFIIILLLAIIAIIYSRFIATSFVQIKEYPITSAKLPTNFNGLKIVHLSDIHYGTTINKKALDKIVTNVNELKPDIIVFTGDLYDETIDLSDTVKNEIASSLINLKSTIGSYAVSGNHDYSNPAYQELIEESGFTYLNNSSKILYYDGPTPIEIVGYPDEREDSPDYSYQLSDYFKIALIHEPDSVDNLLDKQIDVVLSGHSHGGQIRLPYFNALYTPLGAKKYQNDYYEINDTKLYVSYGLGTSLIKFRLFNHPSINFYRLYSN